VFCRWILQLLVMDYWFYIYFIYSHNNLLYCSVISDYLYIQLGLSLNGVMYIDELCGVGTIFFFWEGGGRGGFGGEPNKMSRVWTNNLFTQCAWYINLCINFVTSLSREGIYLLASLPTRDLENYVCNNCNKLLCPVWLNTIYHPYRHSYYFSLSFFN